MMNEKKTLAKLSAALLLISKICLAVDVQQSAIMGLESGEIVNCLLEDITNCTTIHRVESAVFSLEVTGEFIYVGQQSGELRRCGLETPKNCTLFHTLLSEINDLAVSSKFIYAATMEGIVKCGLRKSEECETYYVSENPIYSLAISSNRIFAGTNEAVLSWELNHSEDCTIWNTTTAVNALSVYGDFLYIGLQEGTIQRCSIYNITQCDEVLDAVADVTCLDVFNDILLAGLDTREIVKIVLDGSNETEIVSRDESVVRTIFAIYDTTSLKYHYEGENDGCTWQWSGTCPPFVMYYDIEARHQFEITVKNGKLYTTTGHLFDSSRSRYGHSMKSAIFVMDVAGRIYASNVHPILLLHHSSLMAGKPVAAAGELAVKRGVVEKVSTCSGHYRPSLALTKQVKSSLVRQGYNGTVEFKNCGFGLYIDLDFKKTELYYKAMYEEYLEKMKARGLKV